MSDAKVDRCIEGVVIVDFRLEEALGLLNLEPVTGSWRAESLQDVISYISTQRHIVCSAPTHASKHTLLITRLGDVHLYFPLRQPSNFNWARKKPTLCFPQAGFTFNCALKCRLSNASKGWLVNVRRCLQKPRIHYTWPALLLLFQATERCSSVLQKESRKEYINI